MDDQVTKISSLADQLQAIRSSVDSLEQLVELERQYVQSIQERDRLYHLVLDGTRDLIICFDQYGAVTSVNRAAALLFGCTEADLLGKRLHQLRLQKRIADSWEICRRAAMKPDAIIAHEVQGVFPGGSAYTLELSFHPLVDGRGQITGAMMIGRNLAGDQGGEIPSPPTVALDHVLYQEFAGIAYRGDPGGRFSALSGAVQRLTGYLPEELLNLSWDSLVHPDDRPRLQSAYELLQSSPDLNIDQEYRILTKQGEWRYVREVVRCLGELAGAALACEGIILDVHERKLAEQSSLRLLSLLRRLLAAGPGLLQVLEPYQLQLTPELAALLGEGAPLCYRQLGQAEPCADCAALRAATSRKAESRRVQSKQRVFDCTAHPLLDDALEVRAVLTSLLDVSQQVAREEQARAEVYRLSSLLDNLPQVVLLVDRQYRIRYLNRPAEQTLGKQIGRPCHLLRGRSEPCPDCPLAAIYSGQADECEYSLQSYGRAFQGRARRQLGAEGQATVLLVLDDVTELRAAERQLNYYQLLADRQQDILVIADRDGNILEANAAARRTYRYSEQEFLRLKLPDLGDMTEVLRTPTVLSRQNGAVFEGVQRRSDGSVFPAEVSVQWAGAAGDELVVCLVRDISQEQEKLQAALFASQHDTLTGLLNRSSLEMADDWLLQERNYPVSVVMGDVNGLKLANDAFGYAVGDDLIKAVARAITTTLRGSDIALRFGGDEFVLFLPTTTAVEASIVCERIAERAVHSGQTLVVPSIAWGIATAAAPGPLLSVLMKQAEERMQHSKQLESDRARVELIASLHQRLQRTADETTEHTDMMRQIALLLGRLLNLDEEELHRLSQLALLHDLGKVAIPEEVLQKPDHLTKDEWMLVQRHPETGYRIARTVPELSSIAEEILAHHERWDGTGYPRRLRGAEIPLLCRIIAIADAYTVMVSGRPYRSAVSHTAAASELVRCAGTQFDPQMVRLFVNHHELGETAAAGQED